MKTNFFKAGMYLLIATMLFATCSCQDDAKKSSSQRGIAVKVKASKF